MEAKNLGLSKFSVIEFGVAGGNGLVDCELHAKEISRLTGCEIEIYGFDLGCGLPETSCEKDLKHLYSAGSFKMDEERLQKRLTCSKLVLGNIADTLKTFLEDYSLAPIAVMLIDVDYYSSTVPILELLNREDKYFYPRMDVF